MSKVLILGGVIIDQYYMVSDYPRCGTDTFISEAFKIPGGCSLNVAATLKNLGCEPYLYSKVGTDAEGAQIIDYLKQKGMDTQFIKSVEAPTDYCLVIVDKSGERTFFTHEKLGREISIETSEAFLELSFHSVYVTGYFMVRTKMPSNNVALLNHLSERGTKILFDPSAVAGEIELDVLKALLGLADIITPNQHEAEMMAQKLGAPLEDFIKKGCCLICKDGGNKLSITVDGHVQHMQPYQAKVVDTTGAGDSFAAGLLYGLSEGMTLQESVKVGMACGAITTTFKEPHGIFGIEDIEKIIEIGSVKYDK